MKKVALNKSQVETNNIISDYLADKCYLQMLYISNMPGIEIAFVVFTRPYPLTIPLHKVSVF